MLSTFTTSEATTIAQMSSLPAGGQPSSSCSRMNCTLIRSAGLSSAPPAATSIHLPGVHAEPTLDLVEPRSRFGTHSLNARCGHSGPLGVFDHLALHGTHVTRPFQGAPGPPSDSGHMWSMRVSLAAGVTPRVERVA